MRCCALGAGGLVVLLALTLSGLAYAETYPNKPVRVVVPYPPGGATDLIGRVVAQELTRGLGRNFIIDNRGGATGLIGTEIVARSTADGYTLLLGASGNVMMQPALAPKLPYNVEKDFEPVANIANVANVMVVSPSSPFTSLATFVEHAKRNPGKLRYASGGSGSSGHIAGALLSTLAGIEMLHVPYRGGGLSVLSVINGETDVNFINLPAALPQTRSGKLRGVTVLSPKRSPSAAEYPTTAELGMPEFVMTSSTGLLVPKGSPRVVVTALETALKKIAADPAFAKQFAGMGTDVDFLGAVEYREYIRQEIKRFALLGKRAGITLE